MGTKTLEEVGAGDQGHMFGYATDETPELMPLTHVLATQLGYKLTEVRKNGTCPWLRPDGKTQVTVEYRKEGGAVEPIRVHTILISTQHSPGERAAPGRPAGRRGACARAGRGAPWLSAGRHSPIRGREGRAAQFSAPGDHAQRIPVPCPCPPFPSHTHTHTQTLTPTPHPFFTPPRRDQ
jgi:hypothetical protein